MAAPRDPQSAPAPLWAASGLLPLLCAGLLCACGGGDSLDPVPAPVPAPAPAPAPVPPALSLLGADWLAPDDALVASTGLAAEDLPPEAAAALAGEDLAPAS